MFNWRKNERYNDPNSERLQFELNRYIKNRSDYVDSWEKVVIEQCNNKKVLDIGGIAHNSAQINSPDWRHRKIKEVADYLVGIDILPELINWINNEGYNFICMDATSDCYIGEKFDVVFLGDIIEHMDNIKGLLAFARRHLKDSGCILITTPNPIYLDFILSCLPISSSFSHVNMEHTCWITPTNMNELCYRSNLKYEKIYYVYKKYNCLLSTILPIEWRTHTFIYKVSIG